MSKESSTEKKVDRRRKHSHWQVTITYSDKQEFSRVYTDLEKAKKFAARQKKSPVVFRTKVKLLS